MEQITSQNNTKEENPSVSTPPRQNEGLPIAEHHKKNIYPIARHTLLILTLILCVCIILFLIHQNGKSIYDNGL
jgi:hypothetical protein